MPQAWVAVAYVLYLYVYAYTTHASRIGMQKRVRVCHMYTQ